MLDADEATREERAQEVKNAIAACSEPLPEVHVRVIVQFRCIETWLLGNRKGFNTNAQFHHAYLRAMFAERGLSYTKRNPGHAKDAEYLQELWQRRIDQRDHLRSFATFVELCQELGGNEE